ncbi:MAG: 1-deoxy-D-xylulose-5-phosphate synthase [Oscillospiraceae bacterium]
MEKLNSSADVKALNREELAPLCNEIRDFLIQTVSRTGGHLASNLGVVELTVAIHRVFDTSRDRLVFDVGHQCYVHKILTGRAGGFDTLRQLGGISGFPKPCESDDDAFIAGHASTSVSIATGMARARTLSGENYSVIALLGDGALTGGLAYEALNDAGQSGEPLIVILNDNGMSIAENVGGISKYLRRQRTKPSYYRFKKLYRKVLYKIPGGKSLYRFNHRIKTALKSVILPCSMFEEMGFTYLGPVDGHDIERLTYSLRYADELKSPVLLHVSTIKGKGYQFSEESPDVFHGVSSFDLVSGHSNGASNGDFSNVFGQELLKLARSDRRICAVTAAMSSGTGLDDFFKELPMRSFDVGIAEEHAVTMSAGMAKQGMLPVAAIYSTFLQRAYDMLIHDVSLPNLHVVFGVDRAGITGNDGETHQGIFDVAFLTQIPNMTVLCPSGYKELRSMLRAALYEIKGPVAIRYPRGSEGAYTDNHSWDSTAIIREGYDVTLVTYGVLINVLIEAAEMLVKSSISAEILKLGSIAPLDLDSIASSVKRTGKLLVLEDCVAEGCIGQKIAAGLLKRGVIPREILLKNCGMRFIHHGTVPELMRELELDASSVADAVRKIL